MYENVTYYIPSKLDILINFQPSVKYSDCSTKPIGTININTILLLKMPENLKIPFRKFH